MLTIAAPKDLRPRKSNGSHDQSLSPDPQPKPGNGAHPDTAKKTIRLLLVDDHPVVRKGIRSCLASRENLIVAGEAEDGVEALRLARELLPDLILMDIDMPRMDGLAATEALRKDLPDLKVLILSMHSNSEYVLRIAQCGACGYVLKDVSPEELIGAIEAVHAGGSFFSPAIAQVALNQFVRGGHGNEPDCALLTNREREVLIQVAKGLTNKEIASALTIGVRTVETHRERIMRKLNVHTIAGLTRFALARRYISLTDASLR
jgi:two-component system nitrate/nitrite response regulator NarL